MGNGYHQYQLQWDPETQLADLWVDGAAALTELDGGRTDDDWMQWGLLSSPGIGAGYFNYLSLESDPVAIPEPTAMTLLMIALGVTLLGFRWRQ